jgi:flagellar hook assembly protein FlgD
MAFSLSQNYPNPFNPQTVIEYTLPVQTHVNITIHNILGQRIKVLKNQLEQAGKRRVAWDGRDEGGSEVASGVYFYRIQARDFVECKKMLLLK